MGFTIEWTKMSSAELVIYGPFLNTQARRDRFIPKPLRPLARRLRDSANRGRGPITLFHTGENLRHNHLAADFAISFDLAIKSDNHFRLPYWMEQIDWSHEGISGMKNSRYGHLLKIDRLMQPLGSGFLKRPLMAAFFSSHLREPRKTLYDNLQAILKVDCFGPQFDATIAHHSASSLKKAEVLNNYAFNLCPENSMYPGYYTEKIPEAFHAGCLPITWVDSNVAVDFNPHAFINMAPMTGLGFSELVPLLQSRSELLRFADHPLLLQAPNLVELKAFLAKIVSSIKT
jgi:hypothetical protein